jgi:DNA polymerase III epsilon subunit-like protein
MRRSIWNGSRWLRGCRGNCVDASGVPVNFIGLDFESTGSDPWGRHVPIQIGMALDNGSERAFTSFIGGWSFDNYNDPADSWEWSEEAFGVHGISREALLGAPPVWAVDISAAAWLIDNLGWKHRMFNITVGWNVAGFDRQFVTRWFPNLNRLLSYRTLDLNALVLAQISDEKGYEKVKAVAKRYANEQLGISGDDRHDALIDARAALLERRQLGFTAMAGLP